MSLIPHTFFPRRMFNMDNWLTPSTSMDMFSSGLSPFSSFSSPLMPSTLDIFDPFDELDRMMSRNLQWIDRPESFFQQPTLTQMLPIVPRKYRITVDCSGFAPESIKTELKESKGAHTLLVYGQEEYGKKGGDDYSKRVLRKTFTLPNNIEFDKMASFMAPGGRFVIEFPMKDTGTAQRAGMSLLPQIVDATGGGKEVKMCFSLPDNIDPNKVQVSVKDRDLIMRVEDKQETPDSISRVHIYNRMTLPENTDFNQLKCELNNNQLSISAPVNLQWSSLGARNVPLQVKGGQQQQISSGQQQISSGQQQEQYSR